MSIGPSPCLPLYFGILLSDTNEVSATVRNKKANEVGIPFLCREFWKEFALFFVSRPLRDAIWDFHYPLAVEDVCGRLEIRRDLSVGELEGGGVREDGVTSLVEDW